MSPAPTVTISAQPGPQIEFLRTPADICIYGGAAGGGKTVGLILEPLRHVGRVGKFTAVWKEERRSRYWVLPDNNRDPELTQVLQDAQQKYFARKPRR